MDRPDPQLVDVLPRLEQRVGVEGTQLGRGPETEDAAQRVVVERRQDHLIFRPGLGDDLEHALLKPVVTQLVVLEFDVDEASGAGHEVQHLTEQRDARPGEPFAATAGVQTPELLETVVGHPPGAVGRALERFVMDHDDLVVPGELHVEFDAVGTLLEGLFHRGERVLGGVSAGPAVSPDLRHVGHDASLPAPVRRPRGGPRKVHPLFAPRSPGPASRDGCGPDPRGTRRVASAGPVSGGRPVRRRVAVGGGGFSAPCHQHTARRVSRRHLPGKDGLSGALVTPDSAARPLPIAHARRRHREAPRDSPTPTGRAGFHTSFRD